MNSIGPNSDPCGIILHYGATLLSIELVPYLKKKNTTPHWDPF